MALTAIWYGSEVQVSIGQWDSTADEGAGAWDYTTVEYREGWTPTIPDDTEAVYDGLTYKGEKKIRSEKEITLSQKFMGWDSGLKSFESSDGMVLKATIAPDAGDAPTDATRYYTNFCTRNAQLDSVPGEGAFNISLNGRFDQEVSSEPVGNEDWVHDFGS